MRAKHPCITTSASEASAFQYYVALLLLLGIQRYAELVRFDSRCACSSLQCLGNFGHANFLFCEPLKFINVGGSPWTHFYGLLRHFDSDFGKAVGFLSRRQMLATYKSFQKYVPVKARKHAGCASQSQHLAR